MTVLLWDEADLDLADLADVRAINNLLRKVRIAAPGFRLGPRRKLRQEVLRQLEREQP